MKKFLAVLCCVAFMASSLLLFSCQKQETAKEPEKVQESGGEEAGGYGGGEETGGYGGGEEKGGEEAGTSGGQ